MRTVEQTVMLFAQGNMNDPNVDSDDLDDTDESDDAAK